MTSDPVAALVKAIIYKDMEWVCRCLPTIPDEVAEEIAHQAALLPGVLRGHHAALLPDALRALTLLSDLARRFGARAAERD